jgi:hypothetical protein
MDIKQDLRQGLWVVTRKGVFDGVYRLPHNHITFSLYNSIRNSFEDSIGDARLYNNLVTHTEEYGYSK